MFIDTMEFNNHFSPMGIQNFYKGVVVDNADPKKLGRVKVSIVEIFGNNDKAVLPWVTSFINSPHEFNCPEIGDEIVVFFPYGIVYFPCYIGHWHLNTNHDTEFDADYPDTVGFHRQGYKFIYNKKSKQFTMSHPSGSAFTISPEGGITLHTVEKFSIVATGDVSVTSDAKVTVSGKGGATVESDAEAKFSGKSKTTVGDDSSQTFVNGQMIFLGGPGGMGVAVMGGQTIAIGNLGAPVIGTIMVGSSKVFAPM